jgi:outer membrane murein-binding lipoprotein Lpp
MSIEQDIANLAANRQRVQDIIHYCDSQAQKSRKFDAVKETTQKYMKDTVSYIAGELFRLCDSLTTTLDNQDAQLDQLSDNIQTLNLRIRELPQMAGHTYAASQKTRRRYKRSGQKSRIVDCKCLF